MPLPVIPDVYQVRLKWEGSTAQRPATTSMHFLDNIGTQTAANLATDLDANVTANMWELVSSTAGVTQVIVTKLDGSSASYVKNITGGPAKWSGSGGTDPILQGAIVVSLNSARRGPKWRNRLYLPFVGETGQAAGVLTPANVANMQTGWTAFLASMLAADWVNAVVSPADQDYAAGTQYVVRPYLKSQRRRARR